MTSRDPYQSGHVRRGMRQFLSGRLIQAVASVAVMLIMVRVMSIGEYALYITATALATFMSSVSILGLDRVLPRYVSEGRLKATPARLVRFINKLNGLRLLAVAGLALVVALGWPLLAPQVNLPAQGMTLPVLLFAVIHAFMQFQSIVMQSLMLQAELRNATTAIWLLRIVLLLAVVLGMPPLGAELAVWITLVSEAAGWLWMAVATGKHCAALRRDQSNGQQRDSEWPRDVGEIVRFAWHNYLMGQASFPAQARVQQLVVAALFPPPVVAAFGFFRNLSEQIRNYLPLQLMKNVAEPVMFGRYLQTQNFSQLNAMASAMLKINILLIGPLVTWFWIVGEPAIALLTDGKFTDHVWVLIVLLASHALSSQVTLLNIVANAVGSSRQLPRATITASICTVGLLWTQVPALGVVAVVLSDMAFCAVTIVMTVRGMRRDGFNYQFDSGSLLRMVLQALVVMVLVWLVMESVGRANLAAVLVSGFVVAGTYWGLNMVWKPFTEQERELLKRVSGRVPMPF